MSKLQVNSFVNDSIREQWMWSNFNFSRWHEKLDCFAMESKEKVCSGASESFIAAEWISVFLYEKKLCLAPSLQNPLCVSLNLFAPMTQIQPQFRFFSKCFCCFIVIWFESTKQIKDRINWGRNMLSSICDLIRSKWRHFYCSSEVCLIKNKLSSSLALHLGQGKPGKGSLAHNLKNTLITFLGVWGAVSNGSNNYMLRN